MKKLSLLILFCSIFLGLKSQELPRGRRFFVNNTVIEPVPVSNPESVITSIFDNVYFIKNAKNRINSNAAAGDLISSVPNSKGSLPLISSSSGTPRTEIMKYNPNLGGLINLDNENIFSLLNPSNNTITAPCEIHFTGLLTTQFPYEAYINIYGLYLGEYGGSFRTTNDNTADVLYNNAAFEIGKPFQCRMVFGTDKKVTVYVNGVALGTSKKTYFTGGASFLTRLGLGTDTNNAKWFASSLEHVNRLLTQEEATAVYNANKQLYYTETPIPFPYYKNVNISVSADNVNAVGTYYSFTATAENTALRKYRWYKAGNSSGAPDVTNNTRVPELDNLQTWSKSAHAALLATDSWFRVEIECTDLEGRAFGSASGCVYVKIN